ncbi:MAG: hypothetical protein Q4Q17_01080 [Tissierellia bacterium]|nr:hypothetical protein [Tissierellia bacterium]
MITQDLTINLATIIALVTGWIAASRWFDDRKAKAAIEAGKVAQTTARMQEQLTTISNGIIEIKSTLQKNDEIVTEQGKVIVAIDHQTKVNSARIEKLERQFGAIRKRGKSAGY